MAYICTATWQTSTTSLQITLPWVYQQHKPTVTCTPTANRVWLTWNCNIFKLRCFWVHLYDDATAIIRWRACKVHDCPLLNTNGGPLDLMVNEGWEKCWLLDDGHLCTGTEWNLWVVAKKKSIQNLEHPLWTAYNPWLISGRNGKPTHFHWHYLWLTKAPPNVWWAMEWWWCLSLSLIYHITDVNRGRCGG